MEKDVFHGVVFHFVDGWGVVFGCVNGDCRVSRCGVDVLERSGS